MSTTKQVICSLVVLSFHCFSLGSGFIPLFNPSHARPNRNGLASSLSESLDLLSYEFMNCSVSEIQKILVQKGIEFKQLQEQQWQPSTTHVQQSSLDKISGCVANVYVQTTLYPSNDGYQVQFIGQADALLSRGLLAVLTTALASTCDMNEICSVDSYSIADRIGIRRALSLGRNDGLANMLQTIQHQIQSMLPKSNGIGTEHNFIPTTNRTSRDIAPLYVETVNTQNGPNTLGNDSNKRYPEYISVSSQPREFSVGKKKATVALLLSGGVDSSVALRLLLQQGYDVTAFYLKIWLEDELAHLGQCPWEDDFNVCQEVCKQAGVPLESISLQSEYKAKVISYTIDEAQRGRTPNPDILCNSRIKFGCFYDAIDERGFDFVASGHYARLEPSSATARCHPISSDLHPMRLFRAPDPVKDQSYFLCALSQEQLKRVIFPIGHLQKAQVRELAEEFQLPNRHRADSQGLCFLGKVKFEEFLGAYLGERPGDIVDAATGELLGRHKGVWYHTVGQRKGIGNVLFPLATSRGPWYVVAKDPAKDLVLCSNQYDEDIFAAARSQFHVEDIHWVAGGPPKALIENHSKRFEMKIRHGPKLVGGILTINDPNGKTGTAKLDDKDGGLAPGQYVVFYEGEECFGGGVISEHHWATFLMRTERENNQTISASISLS
jgi:tRNA-5-taurinomethyluridine 2-sulfurtransferase